MKRWEAFKNNFYGFMVWGGGYYYLSQTFKALILIIVVLMIFTLGYIAGKQ